MKGVLEEGTSCCVMKSHAVEGKSGNWHDGETEKVMLEKGKVAIGMTAAALHTSKRKKQEMTCAEPP